MLLKRLAAGVAVAGVVIGVSGAALADGMPGRSVKDAPYVAPFSWTGFYVGANAGAAWMEDGAMTSVPSDAGTAAFWGPCFAAGSCPRTRGPESGSGAIGGLQAGYNLQMQSFLVGIEADIQGSTANASRGVLVPAGGGFVQFEGHANTSLQWLGTVRARLGFLATPTVLAYVTGGWAYAGIERSFGSQFAAGSPAHHYGSSSSEVSGWTAGGGLEWALASRVTIGAEYLYVDLDGGDTFSANAQSGAGGCTPTNCNFTVRASDLELHIARLKVNFKF